jgi:hypothetical protein
VALAVAETLAATMLKLFQLVVLELMVTVAVVVVETLQICRQQVTDIQFQVAQVVQVMLELMRVEWSERVLLLAPIQAVAEAVELLLTLVVAQVRLMAAMVAQATA